MIDIDIVLEHEGCGNSITARKLSPVTMSFVFRRICS